MAWYAGDLLGNVPIKKKFQIAADCYVGQIVRADADAGGMIEPVAAAAAGPDTTSRIVGIVSAVVTSPTYDSTYKGDKATYDTTQALQIANDPVGPAIVEVTLITPTTLVGFPLVKDTIGTTIERKACTTGSTSGLTFVVATIDTTVAQYSTAYCYGGANRGQYRKITTGAVDTQTVLLAFTYDITIGDSFAIANIVEGYCRFDFDTQFQGIDSSPALSSYYAGYCHTLNLEVAGKEFAIVNIGSGHLVVGGAAS